MPSIIPATPEDAPELARTLLEHADSPDDVVTDTSGSRVAFVVSDELAAKAGYGTDDDDQEPAGETPSDDENTSDPAQVEEPPRSGEGSGTDVWRKFLTDQSVEFSADDKRDALIDLWDASQSTKG